MLKISGHNDKTGQNCEGMYENVQDYFRWGEEGVLCLNYENYPHLKLPVQAC
jgi:hypothetical protein